MGGVGGGGGGGGVGWVPVGSVLILSAVPLPLKGALQCRGVRAPPPPQTVYLPPHPRPAGIIHLCVPVCVYVRVCVTHTLPNFHFRDALGLSVS